MFRGLPNDAYKYGLGSLVPVCGQDYRSGIECRGQMFGGEGLWWGGLREGKLPNGAPGDSGSLNTGTVLGIWSAWKHPSL